MSYLENHSFQELITEIKRLWKIFCEAEGKKMNEFSRERFEQIRDEISNILNGVFPKTEKNNEINAMHIKNGEIDYQNSQYKITDIQADVKDQIYSITCIINNKIYIGKTKSHIKNHGRFRPFGIVRRLTAHFTEANANGEHQSTALNDDIRKYGSRYFIAKLLEECELNEGNKLEQKYILEYNTLDRNLGYNIKTGGDNGGINDINSKMTIAKTNCANALKLKLESCLPLKDSIKSIKISLRMSKGNQIVNVNLYDKKNIIKVVQFGGVVIPIDVSIESAFLFAQQLCDNDKIKIEKAISDLRVI